MSDKALFMLQYGSHDDVDYILRSNPYKKSVYLQHMMLTREDIRPDHLERAWKQPNLRRYVAAHKDLTPEQHQRALDHDDADSSFAAVSAIRNPITSAEQIRKALTHVRPSVRSAALVRAHEMGILTHEDLHKAKEDHYTSTTAHSIQRKMNHVDGVLR